MAVDRANTRAMNSAIDIVKDSVHHQTKTVVTNNLSINKMSYDYILLPVWMVNTKYEDKYYLFAMNGQTGEFVGNMPINIKKAIVFGIGIFVLVGLLITLISYFVYLGGSAL